MNCKTAFIWLFLQTVSGTTFIVVDPLNGVNNQNCLFGKSKCETLDFVLKNGSLSNTDVELTNGSHLLDSNYTLTNLSYFKLFSQVSSVINCRSRIAGLYFFLSHNIRMFNIQITGCGMSQERPLPHYRDQMSFATSDMPLVQVAICFQYCQDVFMQNVKFIANFGVAAAFFDVNGKVTIQDSEFTTNTNEYSRKDFGGEGVNGGGVYIHYSSCDQLEEEDCNFTLVQQHNHDGYYKITNTTFQHNAAWNKNSEQEQKDLYYAGAGLLLKFFGLSNNNTVYVDSCYFYNNTAMWGGGLYLSFRNSSQNNTVLVSHTSFEKNEAILGGGGIRAITEFHKNKSVNYIKFSDLNITGNKAIWGGGVSIFGVCKDSEASITKDKDINFSDCIFQSNAATVGFAMAFASKIADRINIGHGSSYRVILKNCKVIANDMLLTEDKKVIGQGALYAYKMIMVLSGNNSFERNNYTALVLDSSIIMLKENSFSVFMQNNGLEGGALALYGNAWIIFGYKSYILFQENFAHRKGGAVYYKCPAPPRLAFSTTKLQTVDCFIRYTGQNLRPDHWPVKMVFKNNFAPPAMGNSVYASTLQFCRQDFEERTKSTALSWKFISYESNGNNQSEVVTSAVSMELNDLEWNTPPDLPFNPKISMRDEKNQSVYGIVKIELFNKNVGLDPPNNIFLVKDRVSKLKLVGQAVTNFSFRLVTDSGQMIYSDMLSGKLLDCPLGYKLNTDKSKCVCMDRTVGSVVRCENSGDAFILKGRWAYKDNKSGLLKTIPCPLGFCKCHYEHPIEPYLCRLEVHNQCEKNRTGILCSVCDKGLSVKLGTEKCQKCSNLSLLMFLPLIIAIMIVVAVIFSLNLDAFSGYLNAYFFYYQMIMLIVRESVRVDYFMAFLIDITLAQGPGEGLGVCLYDGMNNLTKLGINYLVPGILIVFTIICGAVFPQRLWSHLFSRNSNQPVSESASDDGKVKVIFHSARDQSFGKALSFVLVWCYASITGITIQLLFPVKINGKWLVYAAAFVDYFQDEHLLLGILALICLVVIVILFPVILLFVQFFTKHSSLLRRMFPVFQTLMNCYKDGGYYREFSAFYFICRLCLMIIAAIFQTQVDRLIVLSISCLCMLTLFATIQPYKHWSYNFWDTVILLDMVIVSLLSLMLNIPQVTTDLSRKTVEYMIQILLYVPLITVIVRLIWYFCIRLDLGQRLLAQFQESCCNCGGNRKVKVIYPHRLNERLIIDESDARQ